jgi:hypothetical protein
MAVHISVQFTGLSWPTTFRRPDRVRREKVGPADSSAHTRLAAQLRRQARIDRERENYQRASRYLLRR